jgi:hypothetical protein
MWDQMKTTLFVLLLFSFTRRANNLLILGIIEASLLLWMGSLAWCQKSSGPRAWLISSHLLHVSRKCKLPTHNTFWVQNNFYFPWGFCFLALMTSVCQRFSSVLGGHFQSLRFLPSWHGRSSSVPGWASYTFCKDSLFLSSHLWQVIYAL